MVNEFTKIELYGPNNDGQPRRYTIADGTSVSKGQPLQLTDPRTVAAVTRVLSEPMAGVAAEEKVADDGVTSISVWTDGLFEAESSGALEIGRSLTAVDENRVRHLVVASHACIGNAKLGVCYDAVAAEETTMIRVGPI